ncbi:ferrochelatase [Aneurinibacillus thermoaerophilus]|uniref:Coproporphyrin III ferrochelatase n=1 Tax=Aneurinibacillus thermoaerophilus TaxID=143495 RepID=A0A1G8D131_ANETH|nr:ferrochelatase [Aneurinibacillus thermoaerophilus]SDH50870.1 ferrochelatase [Aneurinibacillus thermoaerophilus]
MITQTMGLLVMAYGTPRNAEEIEPYYTHIRRGHKPPPELLQDLMKRYEKIGGISPLAHITEEQTAKLQEALNRVQNKIVFKAYLGFKHVSPFIENAVQQMHKDGITKAVSIVLAPHYSTFNAKSYNMRAHEESKKYDGLEIYSIDSWYKEPAFIEYWADQLHETFNRIPETERNRTIVIFSAHSLPEKIKQMNDPYPEQIEENARMIAEKAGVSCYTTAWQSAGRTSEPWLGPDVLDKIRELSKQGYTSMVFCPIGFVADHLEVLYDNDYECRRLAEALGIHYYRPPMPNTHDKFIEALTSAVLKKLLMKESDE